VVKKNAWRHLGEELADASGGDKWLGWGDSRPWRRARARSPRRGRKKHIFGMVGNLFLIQPRK